MSNIDIERLQFELVESEAFSYYFEDLYYCETQDTYEKNVAWAITRFYFEKLIPEHYTVEYHLELKLKYIKINQEE